MQAEQTITLREKQAAATRDQILDQAYALLVNDPDQPFSHEAIAARAGVGARTVYRYFPAQSDLYEAPSEKNRNLRQDLCLQGWKDRPSLLPGMLWA
jgi:transcriptional regulator GlxA family with amidase domain